MPPTSRRANLEAVYEAPWALLPSTLSRIVEWGKAHGDAAKVVALDGPHAGATRAGSVAVIPVYGVVEHRSDWLTEMFGGTSVDTIRESLAAQLADPGVRAIVLDIDSPGGTVAGLTEIAAEMRRARGGEKPIVAVANSLAASAAYWLASQADEVVVTPSGSVGSIGVYAVHQDVSRMLDEMGVTTTIISAGPHKTEGNEFEPLTEEARADLQSRVDASYAQFLADVAAGRRVTTEKVEADFGGGRVLVAKQALAAGMVDRVETLAATVTRLGSTAGRRRAMAAEVDAPELVTATTTNSATFVMTTPTAPSFSERLATFAAESTDLVEHARERARLRAKEDRPAFSTVTEKSLRTIREAIDALLALDEPATSAPAPAAPVDPAPSVQPPPAAPIRRLSREEWLSRLQESNA